MFRAGNCCSTASEFTLLCPHVRMLQDCEHAKDVYKQECCNSNTGNVCDHPTDFDVLIVGAGIGGIGASQRLLANKPDLKIGMLNRGVRYTEWVEENPIVKSDPYVSDEWTRYYAESEYNNTGIFSYSDGTLTYHFGPEEMMVIYNNEFLYKVPIKSKTSTDVVLETTTEGSVGETPITVRYARGTFQDNRFIWSTPPSYKLDGMKDWILDEYARDAILVNIC